MKYQSFTRAQPIDPADLSFRPVLKVRKAYRYDVRQASDEVALTCVGETKTQRQFKDEVDINNIAKNFGMTGRLPENVRMPLYGDFCDVTDYKTALNAARRAAQSFMEMPAHVRERFQNDPQQFLEFCGDANNREEAIKLGLVVTPPISASVPPPPEAPQPL